MRAVRDRPKAASHETRYVGTGERRLTPGSHEDLARSLLRFLAVLVDVDKLYKAALGTYDFDLAVMVAQARVLHGTAALTRRRWHRRTRASTCRSWRSSASCRTRAASTRLKCICVVPPALLPICHGLCVTP